MRLLLISLAVIMLTGCMVEPDLQLEWESVENGDYVYVNGDIIQSSRIEVTADKGAEFVCNFEYEKEDNTITFPLDYGRYEVKAIHENTTAELVFEKLGQDKLDPGYDFVNHEPTFGGDMYFLGEEIYTVRGYNKVEVKDKWEQLINHTPDNFHSGSFEQGDYIYSVNLMKGHANVLFEGNTFHYWVIE